jgi:Rubisco LSMT substrate-binding/SET domain
MPLSHGSALFDWLTARGAAVGGLLVTADGPSGRGVRVRHDVEAGERVLAVPRACLLTPALTGDSSASGADEQSHLAADLLKERDDPRSPFRAYLDLLPTSFPSVPLFFGEHDLALLRGSYLLDRIALRRASLREDFAALRSAGALDGASFDAFVWARYVVCSRVFGVHVGGRKTLAMVPMADMLNHRIPPEVRWGYDDESEAFVMTAARDLRAGETLHDSYGQKCNARFLLSYGFVLDDNPDNAAGVRLSVPRSDPAFEAKVRLLDTASRRFLVSAQIGAEATRAALAFLRVAHAGEAEIRTIRARGLGLVPLGARTEARVRAALAAACSESLDRFPTSVEDDDGLLLSGGLSPIARSCVVMRRGEKRVLAQLRAALEAGVEPAAAAGDDGGLTRGWAALPPPMPPGLAQAAASRAGDLVGREQW